jgi:hypothetical protein
MLHSCSLPCKHYIETEISVSGKHSSLNFYSIPVAFFFIILAFGRLHLQRSYKMPENGILIDLNLDSIGQKC